MYELLNCLVLLWFKTLKPDLVLPTIVNYGLIYPGEQLVYCLNKVKSKAQL